LFHHGIHDEMIEPPFPAVRVLLSQMLVLSPKEDVRLLIDFVPQQQVVAVQYQAVEVDGCHSSVGELSLVVERATREDGFSGFGPAVEFDSAVLVELGANVAEAES
jgi:hypothetical protein